MSESPASHTPEDQDLIDLATEKPQKVSHYAVPEGYVLVEKNLYESLMRILLEQRTVPSPKTSKEETDVVYELEILRQIHLGDVNYSLKKGDIIYYRPNKNFQVNGRVMDSLRSLNNIMIMQWNKSQEQNTEYRPVFNWINQESGLPHPKTLFAKTHKTRVHEAKVNPLQIEESPQPTDEEIEAYEDRVRQPEEQPRKGQTERAKAIAALRGDEIDRPQGSQRKGERRETVADIPVRRPDQRQTSRVIGKIPGATADEGAAYLESLEKKGK